MRQTTPWLQPDCLFRWLPQGKEHQRCLSILHSFTEKVIQERKVEYYERKKEQLTQTEVDGDQSFTSISCRFFKKNISQLFLYDSWFKEKQRLAFLDLLIEYSENGTVLSDLDIREEVDTFMFEVNYF